MHDFIPGEYYRSACTRKHDLTGIVYVRLVSDPWHTG